MKRKQRGINYTCTLCGCEVQGVLIKSQYRLAYQTEPAEIVTPKKGCIQIYHRRCIEKYNIWDCKIKNSGYS